MAKSKSPATAAPDSDDYQAREDARTLTRASEIQNDTKRHKKAVKHLGTQAQAASDAHSNARSQLEQKTKGRLKKVFAPKGPTFQSESEKEQKGS